MGTLGKMRGIVPRRYATSTLIDSVNCVPWLAAEGPLGYTPEHPPATDYFFQYSWILPEIFNSEVHRRRHHYFGTWTGWNTSARSSTKADRAPVRSDCTIESCCTRGREAFARGTADTVRQATHECR